MCDCCQDRQEKPICTSRGIRHKCIEELHGTQQRNTLSKRKRMIQHLLIREWKKYLIHTISPHIIISQTAEDNF